MTKLACCILLHDNAHASVHDGDVVVPAAATTTPARCQAEYGAKERQGRSRCSSQSGMLASRLLSRAWTRLAWLPFIGNSRKERSWEGEEVLERHVRWLCTSTRARGMRHSQAAPAVCLLELLHVLVLLVEGDKDLKAGG